MKKLMIAALCAASMVPASCSTLPTSTTEQAVQIGTAIDRAQAAYDRISVSANLVLPRLVLKRQARIRLAMALTERGLLAARYDRCRATRCPQACRSRNREDRGDYHTVTRSPCHLPDPHLTRIQT